MAANTFGLIFINCGESVCFFSFYSITQFDILRESSRRKMK